MNPGRFLNAAIVVMLFLGLIISPAPAAAVQWWQQALLLVHIPLGGGNFFTANYVFSATQSPTTVNVRCFNESFQRIGPVVGINVELNATGQVSNETPSTLGVLSDPLFSGTGWCWARGTADATIQTTVGVTTDLSPGGILDSPTSSFVGTSLGLGLYTVNQAGVPFWTTAGGAQHFLILINPLATPRAVTVTLYDANGLPQGMPLVRNLSGRDVDALSIPSAFGLPTPPTSGSIRLTAGGDGYTGWYLQTYPTGRIIFAPIAVDGNNLVLLQPGQAP